MAELSCEKSMYLMKMPVAFSAETFQDINEKLDIIEKAQGPKVLIVTSKHPRLFSGGLDLKEIQKKGLDYALALYDGILKLSARFLQIGFPTIAAINGPCFGAGFLLALAMDYRLSVPSAKFAMREINLGMPLTPKGCAIFKAKLNPKMYRNILIGGKSLSAGEGKDEGFIDEIVEKSELIIKSKELAETLADLGNKNEVYSCVKSSMYHDPIKVISSDDNLHEYCLKILKNNFNPKL
ncbi:unnamed protein product [Blepharisma stoltei]|uniref:Enoyl-CoA hydratase n=1 Tax=Blepharisma stoltei TaxID=1481888 RepID=A0AAU9J0T5_9CILI|nr:unnamed protein product [Blepharisma stoltei]